MSLEIGIYDFFSYMIPGGVVVSAILYILINHFQFIIDFSNISIIYISLFGILSYIFGYVVDAISGRMWLDLFKPKNLLVKTIIDFNERNSFIEVSPEGLDWFIVFTYVKRKSVEIANTIDKLNAQSKMLKNLGFGSVIFSIIFFIEFLLLDCQTNYLLLCISCLMIAVVLTKQAVKYRSWFYASIYQSYVGLIAERDFFPVRFLKKNK